MLPFVHWEMSPSVTESARGGTGIFLTSSATRQPCETLMSTQQWLAWEMGLRARVPDPQTHHEQKDTLPLTSPPCDGKTTAQHVYRGGSEQQAPELAYGTCHDIHASKELWKPRVLGDGPFWRREHQCARCWGWDHEMCVSCRVCRDCLWVCASSVMCALAAENGRAIALRRRLHNECASCGTRISQRRV